MSPLRLTLVQTDIIWENPSANIELLIPQLDALQGQTDVAVLPEMFSTGFTMQPVRQAETVEGNTLTALRQLARRTRIAIAGTFVCQDEGRYYNRAFFLTPDNESFYYDKRHLFRMGGEHEVYTPGQTHTIVEYKGWKILLQVCYDLRFPVWSRNTDNAYDLALYMANWPTARQAVWDTLLAARAIENQCYVAGVNRVGADGHGVTHAGGSRLIDFKGTQPHPDIPAGEAQLLTLSLSMDALLRFREKFPAYKDADAFITTSATTEVVPNITTGKP